MLYTAKSWTDVLNGSLLANIHLDMRWGRALHKSRSKVQIKSPISSYQAPNEHNIFLQHNLKSIPKEVITIAYLRSPCSTIL